MDTSWQLALTHEFTRSIGAIIVPMLHSKMTEDGFNVPIEKLYEIFNIVHTYSGMESKKSTMKLIPWQLELFRKLAYRENSRHISWFVDAKGNVGASTFIKFIADKLPLDCIIIKDLSGINAQRNMANLVMKQVNKGNSCRICIFDYLTHTKGCREIYALLDEIATGVLTNTKGRVETFSFHPEWIIVFSNYSPEVGGVPLDRWDRYGITYLEYDDKRPSHIAWTEWDSQRDSLASYGSGAEPSIKNVAPPNIRIRRQTVTE